MKKYKIAFTGTYDIENYGDHLFPLVFKNYFQNRNIDIEIYLFSAWGGLQGFKQNNKIYKLTDLAQMYETNKFDCVVVGGGGILHYAYGMQMFADNQEFKIYPVHETWIIPSIISYQYDLKLIWNAIGGYHNFDNIYIPLTKLFCTNVDYMSVRDNYTKNILTKAGIEDDKISVIPDTAFYISKSFDIEWLKKFKQRIDKLDRKYIVFHGNRFLPENEIACLTDNLLYLSNMGYKIVFISLANTHNDMAIIQKIIEYIQDTDKNIDYCVIDNNLSIFEIISVLAFCDLYIGVSFHGAVTALSYGKKAIAYDYMYNGKTHDLFASNNISNFYIHHANQLHEAIDRVLNENIVLDINVIHRKIELHFDKVLEIIEKDKKCKSLDYHEISLSFSKLWDLFNISRDYENLRTLNDKMSANYENLNKKYEELKSCYENLDKVAKETHDAYVALKKTENITNKILRKIKK